ncbi:MAG: glycoside hydrolase family 97 N-terminal domain-containing protein, partial [Chitinophagaceae bacterium]|nr:glycoside hydrolase family 97 N-terminal domain-containing protein [Chitinophagaceae bacterium]
MRDRLSLTILMLLLGGMLRAAGPVLRLESPGKQLHAVLYSDNGKLYYSVWANKLQLIDASSLGIQFDNRSIGNDVQQLSLLQKRTIRETRPSRLNSNSAINHCIEYTILVKGNSITDTILFRLFDNGCAFSYRAAGADHGKV